MFKFAVKLSILIYFNVKCRFTYYVLVPFQVFFKPVPLKNVNLTGNTSSQVPPL